ncbi:hypothetical protein ACSX1A_09820 [Pontibacter sp. MBLB2868]|uniref:hypothetical protein n=1 Tax=Pontibacter sp. MBLB2868 TaxID=3451555 RepID=UPI003F74AF3A
MRSGSTKEPSSNRPLDMTAEQLLQNVRLQHERERREKHLFNWSEEFYVDAHNLEPLLRICANFTQDPVALRRYGMKPSKGLLVTGLPGQGKTHFFHLLRICLNRAGVDKSFAVRHVQALLHEFEQFGSGIIKSLAQVRLRGKDLVPVLYDDILSERPARHYGGPEIMFMTEVIEERYKLYTYQNILTYFTTNYRSEEILGTYGERTLDRILGMCNVVVFEPEATNWRTFDPSNVKPS